MSPPIPIREWQIRNLKSVERADLEFAPLTLLVGANSSGKSTVLQSILLAVQAAQARVPGSVFPLNGPLVQLGEFADAHSSFAPGRRTAIGAVFELGASQDGGARTAHWQIELAGKVPSQPGSTKLTSVGLAIHDGRGGRGSRRGLSVRARAQAARKDRLRPVVGARTTSPLPFSALTLVSWPGTVRRDARRSTRIEGLNLVAGFPTHYVSEADEHEKLTDTWIGMLASRHGSAPSRRNRSAYAYPQASAIDELASVAEADVRQWLASRPDPSFQSVPTFSSIGKRSRAMTPATVRAVLANPEMLLNLRRAIADGLGPGPSVLEPIGLEEVDLAPLRLLAEQITYLGPLRQEPQVVYRSTSTLNPRFLGTKGEHIASVLHGLRHEAIVVPMPDGSVGTVRLDEAVNEWLSYLEAVSSIESHDAGRLGWDLRVRQPDLPKSVDLTSVGVGVSQVVPVIMACLLTDPGGVVLLEQPELHLHPAMQQRLADFFLAVARSGRQLIVETHSEYLITRLRLRVAEDESDQTADLIRVRNASKRKGRTVLSPIPINRYGSIEDWPDGFFDQATQESRQLLLAGLAKREVSG